MSPGRQQRGRQRGCGNFWRHKIYKNSLGSVDAGMVIEGQVMFIDKRIF